MKMRGCLIFILILLANSVNALVFTFTEGDFVKLNVKAYDPDGKPLTYTFSEPLNNKGEWQTKIGDAGTYNILVTVSDGEKVTKEGLTLIVKEVEKEVKETEEEAPPLSPPLEEVEEPEKWEEEIFEPNRPPKLEKIKDVTAIEGELVKIIPIASDEDNDEISYGFAYPLNDNGEWQTKIGDSGEYVVTVTATDGKSIDSKTFKIIVGEKKEKEKEREISFEEIEDIVINENEEINLQLKAGIEDGDIEFLAENMPEGATLSGNLFYFKPGYDYVGRNFLINLLNKIYTYAPKKSKTITFIAKSRDEEKRQNVKLTVKDMNREPTLEISNIEVNEGEEVLFKPVINDNDGDWLKISYKGDIKNKYRTNFDDAGNYRITATVSDPYTSVSKDIDVIVKNVNRAPIIDSIDFRKIEENEELKIKLSASDPDDDKLTYYVVEGPGSIKDDVYEFTPDYDFVKKNAQDLISKIKYFNKDFKNNKEIEIKIGVSDGNLTDETSFKVVVYDINRAPEIIGAEPEDSITVGKGGRIVFSVDVVDSDEDELTYKWNFGFMDNLESGNVIARTFTKKGIKRIKVTISDGVEEVEKSWRVGVI